MHSKATINFSSFPPPPPPPLFCNIASPTSRNQCHFRSFPCNILRHGGKYKDTFWDFPARHIPITIKPSGRVFPERTHVILKEDHKLETVEFHKAPTEIVERIDYIKWLLSSMKGGRISISAYDTAWTALIENIIDGCEPQFPTCLQWIADNQLQDGSWGADYIFSAYDRLINTLASVIALKKWNVHPQKIAKGISFIKENFSKLANENPEHMTIGFEIVFPSLVELARKSDIELPEDSDPIMQDIYTKKKLKMDKIPKDILYKEHTTLHFSLEGMEGLDWEKLLKLQCPDGSMLYSPASTAYTFMQTKDPNSLTYLTQLVEKFNGGVPYIYPVDMFARNWTVDRLQRLGICRYFQPEIKECVSYVSRYWTDHGLYSISNAPFYNIDDTAMGFRMLRLHGHKVEADAFWKFKHGDAFCCFPRQSSESVTAMFNFYRASHLMFPGENVLEQGRNFAYKFLQERKAKDQLVDKWVIEKDLPGEVCYALEMPWYASLPRVESRFYIEQYGGDDDIWIGKSLYKMAEVNNNTYLELAKLDYDNCQAQHQIEWGNILEWYSNNRIEEFGMSKRSLLFSYFIAASSIFEQERSTERLAWAKTAILVQMVVLFFTKVSASYEEKKAFIREFSSSKDQNGCSYTIGHGILMGTLVGTLNEISLAVEEAHKGRDIRHYLHQAWEMWLVLLDKEGTSSSWPSEADLLVRTISLCTGGIMPKEIVSNSNTHYGRLHELTKGVCHKLRQYQQTKENDKANDATEKNDMTTTEIESDMQELVQLVLGSTGDGGLDPAIKNTFLTIAKSFYYAAYCAPSTINVHIMKVLFEPIF